MEAEYVTFSTSCKDLFPIIDLTTELCLGLNFQLKSNVDLHVKKHEDNVGALTLGLLELRRMTPHSKHYAIKYHWFCKHISPRKINLSRSRPNLSSVIFSQEDSAKSFLNTWERSLWDGNTMSPFERECEV
jgi:hypothetical protein